MAWERGISHLKGKQQLLLFDITLRLSLLRLPPETITKLRGNIRHNYKSQIIKINIFLFSRKVVKWLCLSVKAKPSIPLHLFINLCQHLDKVIKTRGLYNTIKYVKALRSNLINYLSGNPLRDKMCRCTKDGIPISLGDLIPLIRSGQNRVIAFVLTILTATRALKFKTEPDTSTITQP